MEEGANKLSQFAVNKMQPFTGYVMKHFAKGLIFGFGIVAVLGVYMFVGAVAPGAITNPTFGPRDDDVKVVFPLDCRRVGPANPANCATLGPGWTLTGGGGYCTGGGQDNNRFFPDSNPTVHAFHAACGASGPTSAYAICCRRLPPP